MSSVNTPTRSKRFRFSVTAAILFVVILQNSVNGGANVKSRSRDNAKPPVGLSGSVAIEQLTKVFGIEHVPDVDASWRHHRTAPEYMTDLYNAVAYTDGISKTSSPYNADVVRGFTDKGR